jgi:hypothetical protein
MRSLPSLVTGIGVSYTLVIAGKASALTLLSAAAFVILPTFARASLHSRRYIAMRASPKTPSGSSSRRNRLERLQSCVEPAELLQNTFNKPSRFWRLSGLKALIPVFQRLGPSHLLHRRSGRAAKNSDVLSEEAPFAILCQRFGSSIRPL